MAVLGAAMLVTLIGLAAILLAQSQNRAAGGTNDFAEARLYARSALEMGMYWIHADPFWRTSRGGGTWATNVPIGGGTFSLSVSDPVDGNVASGASDPVVLTGTGAKGQARYQMQVRLETAQNLGVCTEVSLHAGHNVVIDAATLAGDQIFSANNDTDGKNGAKIYADAEAVGAVKGGTYYEGTNSNLTPRTMPNRDTALAYYVANGTAIAYTDLRLWGETDLVVNGSIETGVPPWRALGTCTLSRSSTYSLNGTYSLRVRDRADSSAVAGQDLSLSTILNGNTYYIHLHILPLASAWGRGTLVIETTDGTQAFSTPYFWCSAFSWGHIDGNVTPTWSGQLLRATLTITLATSAEYYMDLVSLTDVTYPADAYVIDRILLSPANNPFGSRQTNPQGIYVLSCGGKKIIIANSRIAATLVLLNPGGASIIQRSVAWEPAVANYPSLLMDSPITIALGSAALSEAADNFNFNPAGTPYPYVGGTADADAADAYPSAIRGLIYSKGNLVFQGQTAVEGVVVADNDIQVQGGRLDLRYGSTWLNNPPPGFDFGTAKRMETVAGTWRRTVP